MPACFLDQSRLTFTSAMTVLACVYIFLLLLFKLSTEGMHGDSCYIGAGRGTIAMVGGMAYCVIIQMCVLPMYAELKDRSPRKMSRVVNMAFVGLFFIFG